MSEFNVWCIFLGVFVVGALFLLIYSFTNDAFVARFLACSLAMCAVITVVKLVVDFDKCPNCGTFTDSAYCQECGAAVDPFIDCSGCEKEFKADKAPAFCPDCGTKIKE